MSDRIRWGILGTGKIAHAFADDLRRIEDAELVAVGSRSADTANRFGDAVDAPRRHASYQALASDPEVDVVYVATPHIAHCEHMLLCLEAGKPVLCEKPFTMNAEQAALVVETARSKRLFAMEAMWTRFVPLVQHIRTMISKGAIGEPRLFVAGLGQVVQPDASQYLLELDQGGGLLLDAVVYPVSLASLFFGPPLRAVGLHQLSRSNVDDHEAVVLEHCGGRLATIYASLRATIPPAFTIYGDQGRIVVDPPLFAPVRLRLEAADGQESELRLGVEGRGYVHEAREVIRCLREGALESAVMPLAETVHVMQTLDGIRRQWGIAYPFEQQAQPLPAQANV